MQTAQKQHPAGTVAHAGPVTPVRLRSLAEAMRPRTETRYCAVAVYRTGETKGSLLSGNRRVVLFDTVEIARQFLPQLGTGRFTSWSADRETAFWSELDPTGISRADIVTGYDPYALPAGMPFGILSEARGREWRHHVMWSHWFSDCGGNMVRRRDGTVANIALGEPVY